MQKRPKSEEIGVGQSGEGRLHPLRSLDRNRDILGLGNRMKNQAAIYVACGGILTMVKIRFGER